MRVLDLETAVEFVLEAEHLVLEGQEELSRLDRVAGDGDHGVNMTTALSEARRRIKASPAESVSGVFHATGEAFLEAVGGAAGGLFGSFFLSMAARLETPSLGASQLVSAWEAGLERVMKIGRVQPGSKTMVDALAPAISAAQSCLDDGGDLAGVAAAAAEAARRGAESTAGMRAAAGRARYATESAEGHRDPGAVTAALLFKAFANAVSSKAAL